MLRDKYNFYKFTYNEYVILIKSGNFYVVLNNDAIVMNNLFNYKIKESTNFIKVGFPINILNRVLNVLSKNSINYIIVDNDIIDKQKFSNNQYQKYSNNNLDNYKIIMGRINKITDILKNHLNNANIKTIINEIENILCKINC